ncbi:hypothetical protein TARUN_8266 [Trichoderma arundinaceum]|uniref:polynucleotide adenylyltransferase n=1 Tax=Trichoderma arundinaceum TaxID=490622 RepID=A0A395NCZ1_TRIAR|nr:hypothetical protein TARUN_8266 [Trichoderma arundinaceum]
MLPNKREPHAAGGDGSASGLEGHLRNLILTNANPNKNPASIPSTGARPQIAASYPPPLPEAQPANSSYNPGHYTASPNYAGEGTAFDAPSQHGPHSPKPARKRPNQAQRRQMTSQLTFSPESRPQLPPYSHPARHNPQWTASQSQSWSTSRPSEYPRARNSWNGPSQSSSNRPQHQNSPSRQFSTLQSHTAHQSTGSIHGYHRSYIKPEEITNQAHLLDVLCHQVVAHSEIDRSEIAEKEAFRQRIEHICRQVITQFEEQQDMSTVFPSFSVELKCFGSLSSGFATKASDMDLGLISPLSKIQPDAPGSPIPRLIEKAFLQAGLGARLLSRTRVPIIKLCEHPPETLLKGLLEEREKWERGADNDTQTGAAEAELDNDSSAHGGDDDDHVQSGAVDVASDPLGEFEIVCKDSGELRRFRLQQGPKHSLDSYYGLAKRVLRRAGGFDVNASNWNDFTDPDWDILNRVCRAFIQGLADTSLQKRIATFTSIPTADVASISGRHRSLFGIFMQVEGEYILRRWELWTEGLPLRQVEDDKVVKQWESLQLRSPSDVDPVSYNRELQLALEKLKKIPSVQLLLLEQDQQETPAQYYTRVRNIINNMGSPPAAREAACGQYVAGIFHEEIRKQLSDYLEQFPEQATIQALGCRHKSIHLANEFERAIENNLYDAAYAPDIMQYIELLRRPLQKRMLGPGKSCYIIPIPAELSIIFAKIKTLTDPHKLAPNQPRDRYRDPLEFPKTDAGVQCDINFSAHLALQNTLLLRCYSHTDPRVRPMILFVKHWAKVRGINSGYRGTLSSYGYVLMVLHYLVNVAQPFVCPNLQQLAPAPPNNLSPAEIQSTVSCRGYNIQFWRSEEEIMRLASHNQLNGNTESLGHLLRGFFEYFAQTGMMSNGLSRGFDWGRNVISLRTHGGILTKQEKGWTGAKTVYEVQNAAADSTNPTIPPHQSTQPQPASQGPKSEDVKEIRLRYLFAVEDPFEIDHNVARTVTHNGIVSIRNEFRRAWRILRAAGNGDIQENLIQDVENQEEVSASFLQLLADIHEPTAV